MLLWYGVRCAHLHLKQCMQELPGLYAACKDIVAALQRAYDEVEAGQLQDHPKLAALKAVLTTVSAIQPVSFALPHPRPAACVRVQHACYLTCMQCQTTQPPKSCKAVYHRIRATIDIDGPDGQALPSSQCTARGWCVMCREARSCSLQRAERTSQCTAPSLTPACVHTSLTETGGMSREPCPERYMYLYTHVTSVQDFLILWLERVCNAATSLQHALSALLMTAFTALISAHERALRSSQDTEVLS